MNDKALVKLIQWLKSLPSKEIIAMAERCELGQKTVWNARAGKTPSYGTFRKLEREMLGK